MSIGGDDVMESVADIFDNEPSRHEKIEMRKASKPPSEWLRLLCRDWAAQNEVIVETSDAKFMDYKPYLKGMLTSQLLCRLSIPKDLEGTQVYDFWEILGVHDTFDRAYIVSQIERFCAFFSIRATTLEDDTTSTTSTLPVFTATDLSAATDPTALAHAAAAGILSPTGGLPSYMDPSLTATAAAAAAALPPGPTDLPPSQQPPPRIGIGVTTNNGKTMLLQPNKDAAYRRTLTTSAEKKEQKARDREAQAVRKASERAAREASREERRKKKIEIRQQREKFAAEQKEAALRRAAELVTSNRVPIEITRGAAAAKAAASQALTVTGAPILQPPDVSKKKNRSAIVVSTAADLNQIVTHSKNLWAKYNAIAKEHNQKVNWTTVAKELGIHVKVREKYARMHSRAEQRGFDWVKNGMWKIKDHPEIFIEPTPAEQKARMPPPPPDLNTTVLIAGNREIDHNAASATHDSTATSATMVAHGTATTHSEDDHFKPAAAASTEADDAIATAAAVVDATVTSSVVPEEQAAALAAATLVADPTADFHHSEVGMPSRSV